jgi:plastocyanin
VSRESRGMPEPAPVPEPSMDPVPVGHPAPAGDPVGDGSTDVVVVVKDMAFTPAEVNVGPGGTVTWEFYENGHSVVADDSLFASQAVHAGGEFKYRVPQVAAPAPHSYHCGNHPTTMRGVVNVVPSGPPRP